MDGLIVIDKQAGLTSHDVVVRARKILHERRIGHTGTLDPFATGVLVLLVGCATRLAQFISNSDKEYEAVIRLGYATDTGDLTGTPLEDTRRLPSLNETDIEAALQSLRGEIAQVPPMYSAKKKDGRKLYELARRGENVERPPVAVCIHEFESIAGEGGALPTVNHDGTHDLKVRVLCSAGTYIRTLAEDFGKRLNLGAHLVELRRIRAGDFGIETALSLDQLKTRLIDSSQTVLRPPDAALSDMPFVHLIAEDERRARQGMAVRAPGVISPDGARMRMLNEQGDLIAVGNFDARKRVLHPRVVLTPGKNSH